MQPYLFLEVQRAQVGPFPGGLDDAPGVQELDIGDVPNTHLLFLAEDNSIRYVPNWG